MATLSPDQVICRPALPRDIGDIKEFCKTIWDGHDYIAEVIDDWLQEQIGLLAVAEYEGRAIACSKLTWLAAGQWWLEGFRVDPRYQGLKVGSRLHHYVCEWWLAHADGTLRLMTNSKNKAVHHLCEQTGLSRRFDVRGYKADPLVGHVGLFTSPARDQDPEQIAAFARASPSLALTDRLTDFGWRIVDATVPGALQDLVPTYSELQNSVFWWRGEKGLLVTWDDDDPDEHEHILGIGLLACQLEDMAAMLSDIRGLAAARTKTNVFWVAPVHAAMEAALEQAGYSSSWDSSACVFEKKHPKQE